jgi:hypothetical protein
MSGPVSPERQFVKTVRPRWQFNLRRLLLWMLGACLVAGFAHWSPPSWWIAWVTVFVAWSVEVFTVRSTIDVIALGTLMLLMVWLLAPAALGLRRPPPRPSRPASLQ